MMGVNQSLASLLLLSSIAFGSPAFSGEMSTNSTQSRAKPFTDHFKGELINSNCVVIGEVRAKAGPKGMLLQVRATSLPVGFHAVHIHAVGDCTDHDTFELAGGHVAHDDDSLSHSHATNLPRGDLPNLYAHKDGTANADYFAGQLQSDDFRDADGAALIIHARPDNHWSEQSGSAGPRIACATFKPCEAEEQCQWRTTMNETPSVFPESLVTETPHDGFELAIKLSRLAVKAAQSDVEVLQKLRPVYSTDAGNLIASSHVVAVHFQTIAAANDHWRDRQLGQHH